MGKEIKANKKENKKGKKQLLTDEVKKRITLKVNIEEEI